MGGLDPRIGELIETPRQTRDGLFPDKAGQRLRSDAFGHEVRLPQHSAGFQEIEGAGPLGACRGHRAVTTPLLEQIIEEVLSQIAWKWKRSLADEPAGVSTAPSAGTRRNPLGPSPCRGLSGQTNHTAS